MYNIKSGWFRYCSYLNGNTASLNNLVGRSTPDSPDYTGSFFAGISRTQVIGTWRVGKTGAMFLRIED